MNKDKILKNPLVVTGLCLAAVAFILVNNVLPLLPKRSDSNPENQIGEVIPIQNSILPEPVLNPGAVMVDSIKKNSLQTVGWKRIGGRDPFLNEIRKNVPIVINQPGLGVNTINQSKTTHNELTLRKPSRPVKKLIQAISIGKTEKVVMLGTRMYHEGDTCNLGIISLITPDSVIIHGPDGVRVLQF